jgi:hypothetical protein
MKAAPAPAVVVTNLRRLMLMASPKTVSSFQFPAPSSQL